MIQHCGVQLSNKKLGGISARSARFAEQTVFAPTPGTFSDGLQSATFLLQQSLWENLHFRIKVKGKHLVFKQTGLPSPLKRETFEIRPRGKPFTPSEGERTKLWEAQIALFPERQPAEIPDLYHSWKS